MIPLPAKLNALQRAEDVAGLVLTTPTITAPASDDTATVVELNGTPHRIPREWDVAEAKHGESDIAFLRRGSEVRVLAGDREGRVHEVRGYRSAVLDEVRSSRFGAARQTTEQDAEVNRLLALSDGAARPLSEAGGRRDISTCRPRRQPGQQHVRRRRGRTPRETGRRAVTASEAWRALQDALAVVEPSCRGDDRFTSDDAEHDGELRPICEGCPVRVECAAYARAAPRGSIHGVWGGHARRASREPRGRSQNLTPEEVARIHQLRAEGLPLAAIADRLGVGVTTVGRRARLAVESG